MKKLGLLFLLCVLLPMQHGVIAQQSANLRFANDWCYPGSTDNGWETMCNIQVADGLTFPGHSPSWSPGGLRIAYLSGDLHVYDRTADSSVRLTEGIYLDGPVSWSRDGAHIAVVGWFEGLTGWTRELLVIDPDGSNLTRPMDGVQLLGTYAWSPSSDSIAFGRGDGGVQELYIMAADGSNQRRLTNRVGFAGAISWSPDGGRIAFDCGTTICAIDVDGTNLVQLAPPNASTAIFSPVGGQIAFLTGQYGYGDLKVRRSDGSIVQVAPGFTATKPAWSADGANLAFVQEAIWGPGCNADGSPCGPPDETYIVKPDGTGLAMFAFGSNPAWFVPVPGQPVAAFTADCAGNTCQFNAAGSFDPDGAIASYEWKFGDGTTGAGPAPLHTYSTGATYHAILIVTDNDGTMDVTRRTVTANRAPVASFNVACSGPTCTFDGSASVDSDGVVTQYSWQFGDGSGHVDYFGSPAHPVITHTYLTGTFTATLSVTDNAGASSAVSAQAVTVTNARPVASFTVTCTGLSCTYDASTSSDPDGTIAWYGWNFGDSGNNTGRITIHTYQSSGTYTITLTVGDAANQTSTVSQTVTVVAPPPPAMHVGDLEASSTTVQKWWHPQVTISLHTENHGSLAGVQITGVWDDGATSTCVTDESGRCFVNRAALPRKSSSASFRVTDANRYPFVFRPGANHDADGDSNGTTIVVRRQ